MGDGGRAGKLTASAVVVVLVVAALWVAKARQLGPRELALPPAGEVTADWLDGHPVFVVHAEPGEVLVLDAASPHDPQPKVLVFCRTSRWFEDLWHGSKFDRRGWWTGGPAPTGMARYEILEQDTGSVVVGDRGAPPARETDAEREEPAGPACSPRTALNGPGAGAAPDVLADLVLHDPGERDDVAELRYATPARVLGEEPRAG